MCVSGPRGALYHCSEPAEKARWVLVAPEAVNPGNVQAPVILDSPVGMRRGGGESPAKGQQKASQSSSLTCSTSLSLSLSWSI